MYWIYSYCFYDHDCWHQKYSCRNFSSTWRWQTNASHMTITDNRKPTWWCWQLPFFPVSGALGHASPPPGSQLLASSALCSSQSPEDQHRNNSRVITEVLFFSPTKAWKDRLKGELYLRVFGDPVTQHIQDPVCGSSPDNKLFVPIPLVCRKTWNQVWQSYSQAEFPHTTLLKTIWNGQALFKHKLCI